MRALLLGIAATGALALPAPAEAQETTGAAFVGIPNVTVHRGSGRDHGQFDRRFRGRSDTVLVYDREWQGDSAWRPDSFNDWWHERPDRNMPRWMANNQNCQRIWWSGGGWRC